MLSALKRLVLGKRPFRAEPPAPDASGFSTRGRRWNPASVEPPWFERADAASRAGEMARKHGLGEAGEQWLRKWIQDGYFTVEGAVEAQAVARYAEEFERVWWLNEPVPGLTLSDVTIGGEYHVHIPHAKLLSFSEAERREARRVSNWRVGEFYQSSKA